jgi:hypothetical protein
MIVMDRYVVVGQSSDRKLVVEAAQSLWRAKIQATVVEIDKKMHGLAVAPKNKEKAIRVLQDEIQKNEAR